MKLILVGCGNMGFAMLKGWLEQSIVAPADAYIVEPADSLRDRAAALGVSVYTGAEDLPESLAADVVILAVKPQIMADVAPAYKRFAAGGVAIASVAAGITVASLSDLVGQDASIIRVMPNTPAAVGKGMMVLYANAKTSLEQRKTVEQLMAASGDTAIIDDEALMDAVTGVSGSGPAYIFHMIEALRDAGTLAGLPDDIAARLAMQTVYGAAVYAKESGEEPGLLREQVTSPNGTTQAALEVLMDRDTGLPPLMARAVKASSDRSAELGQ